MHAPVCLLDTGGLMKTENHKSDKHIFRFSLLVPISAILINHHPSLFSFFSFDCISLLVYKLLPKKYRTSKQNALFIHVIIIIVV
ncbi:hypothetical protein ACJX0J_022822, partial [Zea mays]